MDAPAGSVIAPILMDAPQDIEAALSVRFERVPEEVVVAGPFVGTATEYEQDDDTSNYQAAPFLIPADATPGDYNAVFSHAALARPVRIPYRVSGAAPSVVTFEGVLAAVETLMRPRLRLGGFSTSGGGRTTPHFEDPSQNNADPADDHEGTWPTLSTATEAVSRHMRETETDYSLAEDEDAPALVTVAALRAAIELESSHYPEQVASDRSPASFWQTLLERYEDRLGARESVADVGPDEGQPGMDAVWNFGPTEGQWILPEGSEVPIPVSGTRRRREW